MFFNFIIFIGVMVENILDSGRIIKCKAKAFINGRMEGFIKEHLMGIIVDMDR